MHTAVLSSQKSTNKGSQSTMREPLMEQQSTTEYRIQNTLPSHTSDRQDRSATFRGSDNRTNSRSNPESMRQPPTQ